MTWYDYIEQDEQSCVELPEGGNQWTGVRVYDWWETVGPDGNGYATGITRDAAILSHRESHVKLMEAQDEIRQMRADYDPSPLTPICGVRHRMRREFTSGWESVSQIEPLDHDSIIHDRQAI